MLAPKQWGRTFFPHFKPRLRQLLFICWLPVRVQGRCLERWSPRSMWTQLCRKVLHSEIALSGFGPHWTRVGARLGQNRLPCPKQGSQIGQVGQRGKFGSEPALANKVEQYVQNDQAREATLGQNRKNRRTRCRRTRCADSQPGPVTWSCCQGWASLWTPTAPRKRPRHRDLLPILWRAHRFSGGKTSSLAFS